MPQDSHSHSGARYTTNWPAVIGVALLVPIAVSGPIVSLLFSPASSESRRPVVREVAEPVEITASKRLPFQGPPATAPLPALDSDPIAASENRVAEKQTPNSISDRPVMTVPAAPREAAGGEPLDATLAAVTNAKAAQRTPIAAAAAPQLPDAWREHF